jgi:hypothetical protein
MAWFIVRDLKEAVKTLLKTPGRASRTQHGA